MEIKRLVLGTLIAGIFAAFFGGRAFATAGNVAEIPGGKTWNICVDAGSSYAGSDFSADIMKSGFNSQIVLGNGGCKAVKVEAGTYAVSLNGTMGTGAVSYEIADNTLTFNVVSSLRKFINVFGSIAYSVEGSGEESQFDLLFSMPGECQFNGNANVSGETCKDGDGNSLTNKKYIDTGVALFSEDNAAKDFEIYFTLTDYAATQTKQGTLFNAKYENSSMYYPGFTIRTVSTDGEAMEITGRLGKDNTNADKANNGIATADIKNKEVKIVRVGGMVSYSIDGGELIPFQDYKNFSRYFEQTAVFGASMQANGSPQRYYDGTIKDIRVLMKKAGTIKFDANGGTGTMGPIRNIALGTDVVLPANTFVKTYHVFTGWNTEIDGSGVDYSDGATVTVSSDDALILYAQWRQLMGSIEFDANGGTGIMATIENIPVGMDMVLPANAFTKTYFIFDGWNTKNDGSGEAYSDGATIAIFAEDTLTLYAQWKEAPKGRIEFLANGGAGSMTAIADIDLGTDIMLPLNAFVMDGATFDGWNTRLDGAGINYADGATIVVSASGTTKLYAQWNWGELDAVIGNGPVANGQLKTLASGTEKSFTSSDEIIESISFVDVLPNTVNENTPVINIAKSGSRPINAYWVANDKAFYIYAGVQKIYANDVGYLFCSLKSLTSLSLPSDFDTANATYANNMFNQTALTSLVLPDSFDTSRMTSMFNMFGEMTSLTSLTLPVNFNTSNVTDMSRMFEDMSSLTSLVFSPGFDTSKVKNMNNMFGGMKALTSLTLPVDFNTSNVKNMEYMFGGMSSLTSLTFSSGFDTSSVTNMTSMFSGTSSLTSLVLPEGFNTSNVTSMNSMFGGMSALTSLTFSSGFDTSSVTTMSSMFGGTSSLTSLVLPEGFNTSNVTSMNGMFGRMSALTSLTFSSGFDTSSVTNMTYMFGKVSSLTSLVLPEGFNTSNVTSMNSMFRGMSALTSLTFSSGFDTSSVTDMMYMFGEMTSLTSLVLPEGFNTSNVTNMKNMFFETSSLELLEAPDGFIVSDDTSTSLMFNYIQRTAVLYASDAKLRSLWPGVLGN